MKYELKKAETRLLLKETEGLYNAAPISSAEDAVTLIKQSMAELDVENIWVVNLSNQNKPINYSVASIGGLAWSFADPANIFKTAILSGASKILLAHNHPSGDPTPSSEDFEFTKGMIECGKILGIQVLDHIVVGGNDRYYSFMETSSELFAK